MTRLLENSSVQELVAEFAAIGVGQDKCLLEGDVAKFNRLFERMRRVSEELRRRGGDQRHALFVLFEHPNLQVRLKAAKHTLSIAPAKARRQIELIAESKQFPQAGEAGMTLTNLDIGIFKPV